MTADKRSNSVHCRLSDEADAQLELMAVAAARDKGTLGSELLEEALMGRAHALTVAAHRYARRGIGGHDRETT